MSKLHSLNIYNLSLTNSRFNIYYNLFKLFEKILPDYRYHSPFSIISQGPMIKFTNQDFKDMKEGLDPGGYCVTLTYLYLYIFIKNLNNYDFKDNPLLHFSKLMYKINQCNDNVSTEKCYTLDHLRIFAFNLFQYYYKYISNLIYYNKNEVIITPFLNSSKYLNVLINHLTDNNYTNLLNLQFKIKYIFTNNDEIKIIFNNDNEHTIKKQDGKWENKTDDNNIIKNEIFSWLFYNYSIVNYQDFLSLFIIIMQGEDRSTGNSLINDYKTCYTNSALYYNKYLKYKYKYNIINNSNNNIHIKRY